MPDKNTLKHEHANYKWQPIDHANKQKIKN
jgi:hypothetical protein